MQADTGFGSFCEFESSLVWYEEQGAVPGAREVGVPVSSGSQAVHVRSTGFCICGFCAWNYKVFVHEFCGQTTTMMLCQSDWQSCREQGILSGSQYTGMQIFPTVLILYDCQCILEHMLVQYKNFPTAVENVAS
jgi:hypothetical protein